MMTMIIIMTLMVITTMMILKIIKWCETKTEQSWCYLKTKCFLFKVTKDPQHHYRGSQQPIAGTLCQPCDDDKTNIYLYLS